MHIERAEAVKRIKAALKKKTGKTWSVHGGRGTAWGWITVEAPARRRVSHKPNPAYISHWETPGEPWGFEFVDSTGENYDTGLADREELATAFGLDTPVHHQGLSISPAIREFYVLRVEAATEPEPLKDKDSLSVQTETETDNGALYEFAQLVKPGDAIEFHVCEDGSAGLTAIRNNRRAVSITFEYGKPNGTVYDISKINKPGYIVYPRGSFSKKQKKGGNHESL